MVFRATLRSFDAFNALTRSSFVYLPTTMCAFKSVASLAGSLTKLSSLDDESLLKASFVGANMVYGPPDAIDWWILATCNKNPATPPFSDACNVVVISPDGVAAVCADEVFANKQKVNK